MWRPAWYLLCAIAGGLAGTSFGVMGNLVLVAFGWVAVYVARDKGTPAVLANVGALDGVLGALVSFVAPIVLIAVQLSGGA
ncbi:MAG: hypothetical protein LPL00_00700 [Alphaproteobacteria bacterium]|nr:hypothetical protein [Alphaproteobacteria bacterium]MDX5367889.1 hypothetical protein [Alphaproteobacteria bacterium]MDX5462757.1 hypothetical protein [Alphaproteobacteria bacterium]